MIEAHSIIWYVNRKVWTHMYVSQKFGKDSKILLNASTEALSDTSKAVLNS